MLAGLVLFAATLVLQASAALSGSPTGSSSSSAVPALRDRLQAWQLVAPLRPGSRLLVPTLRAWLAALALVHATGIFSFFYLLNEGGWVLRGWPYSSGTEHPGTQHCPSEACPGPSLRQAGPS